MADKAPKDPPSRYARVRQILDQAAADACADYQGYGKFWNLPLADFLNVTIYGVRMIAPPSPTAGDVSPRDIADGATTQPACCGGAAVNAAPQPAASGSCCAPPPAQPDAGRGARSGLVQGLRGQYPFDGSQFPRLPWGGTAVSAADVRFIESWIDAGCPASDTQVEGSDDTRQALAHGDAAHPPADRPTNASQADLGGPKLRQNIACLTPDELRRFRVAVAEMMTFDNFPLDPRSFAYWAQIHASNCQHGWEEFLPWHRAYLYEFELRLQDVDPTVTLPYWDWTEYYEQNHNLGVGKDTGIDQGVIPEAYACWIDPPALDALAGQIPAATYQALVKIKGQVYLSGTRLFTAAGLTYGADPDADARILAELVKTNPLWIPQRWPGGGSTLFEDYPSPDDVTNVLKIPNFFQFGSGPQSNHFFGALENIHNLMHNFSGGVNPTFPPQKPGESAAAFNARANRWSDPQYGFMVDSGRTAYDPIFWGHHSNVDRLWAEWQTAHPGGSPDNPQAVLPPWAYQVVDMKSTTQLGYAYALSAQHFPTDPTLPMTRFKSAKAGVPAHALAKHQRAEIRLHNVRYGTQSGVVRAFLNAPDADASTATRGNDHYVGQTHLFAGACIGAPGHCEPPAQERRPCDHRPRHPKTPHNVRFDATDTIARLRAKGDVDFHVHLVALDVEGKPSDQVLQLEGVSLTFFD